ncbi:MAG: Uma2 family endonuclease [Bacteroidia bacterium]|nr:Uma2 family endonuclease [Bacteroidia bacterium]
MKNKHKLLRSLQAAPDLVLLIREAEAIIERETDKRHKFYELIHEDHKAEFINGEVVFRSPVRRQHWRATTRLAMKLSAYVERLGLGEVGIEKVMISLTRNDYEPDVCFFRQEVAATFTPEQMLFPAPDFLVEVVSNSTEKTDRGEKFVDYAAHGVQEYWIVDPRHQCVEQYLLQDDGTFMLHAKVAEGVIRAQAVPGFSIDAEEIF